LIIRGTLSLRRILTIRHEGNPEALASLQRDIRHLSIADQGTPGSTPPAGSFAETPNSRPSTGHESSSSIPPIPPIPSSYRSDVSGSPTSDSERTFTYPNRYPTPPPTSSPHSYPSSIRPPPAVARLAGKEKKKDNALPAPISPPTSHPSPLKEKASMLSWAKKDTKVDKWESGVIGRERARIVVDGNKRCYPG
jgi:hypothetical protein